jgi:hypothetical protein
VTRIGAKAARKARKSNKLLFKELEAPWAFAPASQPFSGICAIKGLSMAEKFENHRPYCENRSPIDYFPIFLFPHDCGGGW